MEAAILESEREVARLEARLAEPAFYAEHGSEWAEFEQKLSGIGTASRSSTAGGGTRSVAVRERLTSTPRRTGDKALQPRAAGEIPDANLASMLPVASAWSTERAP